MSLLVPGRGAWCPRDGDEQAELVADCVELDGLAERSVPRAGKGDSPILDDRRGAPTQERYEFALLDAEIDAMQRLAGLGTCAVDLGNAAARDAQDRFRHGRAFSRRI